MKAQQRKFFVFFLFLLVLGVQLFVLSRSVENYLAQKEGFSPSPDKKIALVTQNESTPVLGATTNPQLNSLLDKYVLGSTVFILLFLLLLWSKEGQRIFKS